MYHALTHNDSDTVGHIHISLHAFTSQIQWLATNGYTSVTVQDMYSGGDLPEKKVVITFDDGYYSLYALAWPVLKQYGFTATLFVTTGAVDAEGYEVLTHLEKTYPYGDRPLTWTELKEMERGGWDIQAHGHQHLVHNMLPEEALFSEMAVSKQQVQEQLHKQVNNYAFPYGRYNSLCLKLAYKLGFEYVFTVQPGLASRNGKVFAIPRLEINRYTTLPVFARQVQTGYTGGRQQLTWFFLHLLYRNIWLKDGLKGMYDVLKKIKER